jgi:hypothetical protein
MYPVPVVKATVVATAPVIRKVKFDPNTKHANHTMILDQLIVGIKSQDIKEYEIDMTALAKSLSELILRFRKTALELIVEYKAANGNDVVIMGRQNNVPYRGTYDKANDSTNFDLLDLPPSLVIILHSFVAMTLKKGETQG